MIPMEIYTSKRTKLFWDLFSVTFACQTLKIPLLNLITYNNINNKILFLSVRIDMSNINKFINSTYKKPPPLIPAPSISTVSLWCND